ncbi:hypothetical protein J437_LFUL008770 [Ladona fulva]|uniref:Transposase n=1 Tax=Ladona fulva TaxID=123851 RepID=A0A8K0K1C1_LADFU|nr:hypothetical protein J437_LFUL008770 [Ladona fulva]
MRNKNSQGVSGNDTVSSLERELVNPHKLTLRDLRVDSFDFNKVEDYVYDIEEEKAAQDRDIRTLFWELQHSNVIQISAKNESLYKELNSKQTVMYDFLQKCTKCYKRIDDIKKICQSLKAQNLEKSLSQTAAYLFAEQFSPEGQSESGHYWTTEEKVKALSINRDSPKLYIILEKILALPPRRELRQVLNAFDINTGVNNIMFQSIADRVKKIKKNKDKYCYLLFDEFPIESGLHHQQGIDKIIGFEDLGIHGQSKMPVSYALLFILRGVTKNWYQPIAYYFCHKTTPTIILNRILAEVIESVNEIGLKILAIVCDKHSENVAVLHSYLAVESKNSFTQVGKERIVTIFDPPSLLRSFRDNFRLYHIHWHGKVAKWKHIEKVFEREQEEEFKLVEKLTKDHLQPKGDLSSRIDLAEEVLSYRMASAIYIYASTDAPGRTAVPWEAMSTPNVLATIDRLYCSFNNELKDLKEKNKMYSLLSETSNHFKFWSETLKTIDEWKFVDPHSNMAVRPLVQDGWISNMKACLSLRENLKKIDIKSIDLRRLNLDPMRKIFSALRQDGRHPSCLQFVTDLKIFLLNEETLSSSCNLRTENNEYLLTNLGLHSNIYKSIESTKSAESDEIFMPVVDTLWAWEEPTLASYEAQSIVWISAFLAKAAIDKFSCEICKSCLVSDEDSAEHFVIGEQSHHLVNPRDELCWLVSSMMQFCSRVLPNIVYECGVVAKLTKVSCERLDIQWLKKCYHAEKLSRFLLSTLSRIYIHQFCKKCYRMFKSSV